jgi:hypothetical protein
MILRQRRIRHERIGLIALGDDVIAHPEFLGDHARQRRYTTDVHFLQLFDPTENAVELVRHGADLLIGQRDASEAGNMADGFFVNGHGLFVVLEYCRVASNRVPQWQASRETAF